jgi:[ribosomal protein S18]-alanine N-acetyltransferase
VSSRAITIRYAESRDARAIALLSRDHIEHGLDWRYDARRIQRAMGDHDTVVLVACDGGSIAGFAIMQFGEDRAHLVLLAVRPLRRRSGVGRALVDWLLASARTAGIASVHLELRTDNEAAEAFYRRLGFTCTVRVPKYYQGRIDAQRMLRMLREPVPEPWHWEPPRANSDPGR